MPEIVIEGQVHQRPIHIQKNCLYLCPIYMISHIINPSILVQCSQSASHMISTPELKELMHSVNSISMQAGKVILEYYNSDYDVSIKQDKSPVTSADLAANEHIEQKLQALTPEIPRISEESAKLPYESRKHWDYMWLIDPLDGTRQFIKNKPDFTVNIALIHRHRPILGSIYLPVEQTLYYACDEAGAHKQMHGQISEDIHVCQTPQKILRICANQSGHSKTMQYFLNMVNDYQLISRGSSIKSCLVAEGSADIYPRIGPTWEWDTAAAQCILEQAGGSITDLTLDRLVYNKASLLNPSFIAHANQQYDWRKYFPKYQQSD